jgi:hypothetical protein
MSSPDLPEPLLAGPKPPQPGPLGGRCRQFALKPRE